jgi:hypothetical protein
MRIVSVGELFGPCHCEHLFARGKRKGECCGKECWELLLSSAEVAQLPVWSGPEAITFIFQARLGRALCAKHFERPLRDLRESEAEDQEINFIPAPRPALSANVVTCEYCEVPIGEEEGSFESDPTKGEDWFKVTHRACGKTFSVHHRDFYKRDGAPPQPGNPFSPVLIPLS